jgi:hypothetical protein
MPLWSRVLRLHQDRREVTRGSRSKTALLPSTGERAVTARVFHARLTGQGPRTRVPEPGNSAAQRSVRYGRSREGPADTSTTPDRCPSQPTSHSSRRPVITYRPDSPRWNGGRGPAPVPLEHVQATDHLVEGGLAALVHPVDVVPAALQCSAVLQRAGSPRASCRFRRFPVDIEEFEPEILDSPQQAVQGRLVGSGAPQHRRTAHHAHLRVVEGGPHPRTGDTADGDHVSAIGYFSGLRHCYREPPDRVSCPHPFRVRRSVVAWGRDNPGPELGGKTPDGLSSLAPQSPT